MNVCKFQFASISHFHKEIKTFAFIGEISVFKQPCSIMLPCQIRTVYRKCFAQQMCTVLMSAYLLDEINIIFFFAKLVYSSFIVIFCISMVVLYPLV